jgi:hypothetical protein
MSVWCCWAHLWAPKSRIHIKDLEANNQDAGISSDIQVKGESGVKTFFEENKSEKIKSKKNSRLQNIDMFGKLVIVVTDSGVGLSEGNLNRLFNNEEMQFTPENLQEGDICMQIYIYICEYVYTYIY